MIITVDLETYYSREYSLSKMTTEEYVRGDEFEVIGVGVKVDENETTWFSGSKEQTQEFLNQYDWANSFVLAHNTAFDGAILSWLFGVKPKGWLDTLCMARAVHGVDVGGSLAFLAQKYELGEKGTEVVNALGKHRSDFSPEDLERYGEYCKNDVDLTHRLFKILAANFPKSELKVIDCTLRMFTEPTLILDLPLLEQHLHDVKTRKEKLLEAAAANRDDLMSNDKFAELLKKLKVDPPTKISPKTGREAWAFAKTDEEFKELASHPDPRVQTLVAARLGNKTTLEETRTQRFIDIAKRGRMPVPLKYYAAHTGRWGGDDKVNLQNLPARGQNAGKLKSAIRAPKGYVIIDADSSQIEARTVAWLAGQTDLVEFFQKNNDEIAAGVKKKDMKYDPYKIMAAQIYNKDVNAIEDSERFVGKTTILGCFGADTKVLTDSGWKRIVEVQTTDMVWDGEEWVKHQGVIPKGVRETITAYGIDATPEHEILTEHGWREWHEVVTNHTLFQSALNRANLPSSTGHNTQNRLVAQQDGTRLSNVAVDGKVKSIAITLKIKELQDVIRVQKSLVQKLGSITGGMKLFSLTNNTGQGYLTEFHRAYQDVITHVQKSIRTMGTGVSLCTPNGALTVQRFSNTYSRSKVGKILQERLTGWMSIKGTSREILGLQLGQRTCQTAEKQKICKRKLMTYDIAYAGPRNRFTIATDAGVLIVHNCGYGMGGEKFQAQLKVFGVDIPVDECKRIISIYRATYDSIPALWRQAQNCLEAIVTKKAAGFGANDAVVFDAEQEGFLLPSGLWQRYSGLEKVVDSSGNSQFQYKTRKGITKVYGGKVIENICQAVARCIIAEQMLLIGKRYKVVLTVHDAVACIAPKEEVQEAVKYVEECMRYRPDWCKDLPLNCEVGYGESYGET